MKPLLCPLFPPAALAVLLLGGCLAPAPGLRELRRAAPEMPRVDPALAPAVRQLSEAEVQRGAVALVKSGRVRAAVRAIDEAEEGVSRQRLRLAVTGEVAVEAPALAGTFALALAPGPTQQACIETLVRAWWPRDRVALRSWALGLPGEPAATAARQAWVNLLTPADLPAFCAELSSGPRGPGADETLALAVATWAGRAAPEAVAWVRGLPAGQLQGRLTSSALFAVAQRLPVQALAWVSDLPEGRERWLLYTAIAQTWVAVDPTAALAWANRLAPEAGREAALAGIDTGFGVPGARRLAAEPVGSARGSGGRLADRRDWPELQSPEFSAWVAVQPAGMSRDEAVMEFVRQRVNGSGGDVGAWITSLPGGPTRERALEVYVDSLMPRAPAAVAEWLRTLPVAEGRDRLVERLAQRWLLLNPGAAEAWLRGTNLPPERQEWLLRQAGR